MYRHRPTIKHPLPPDGARPSPTARLFQPLTAGPLALRDRTWVPAMVPWRATPDGEASERVVAWYRRFAEGRPAALVVEATGIRDVPSGPLLRIGHDRYVPGLRRLVDAVREASGGETRLLIQLIDFLPLRRRPAPERYFREYLRLTHAHRAVAPGADDAAVREALLALPPDALARVLTPREREALEFGARERVTDLHLPAIRALPQQLPGLFADAARRAEAAGFDGVELHMAHAYTLASFLSRTNTRDDGYGGDLAGRLRLPLEVIAATRGALSAGTAVAARMLTEECVDGGTPPDESAALALALAPHLDVLSLSRGGKFDDARQPKVGAAAYPYTGLSGWECMPTVMADARGPFGRNLDAARTLRTHLRGHEVSTPVVVAGGLGTFEALEDALASGAADLVASARQTLADPDWFQKLRDGRPEAVRRCTFTNYCEGLDQAHKVVTCKLWDREALHEPGLDVEDGRRLLAPPSAAADPPPAGR